MKINKKLSLGLFLFIFLIFTNPSKTLAATVLNPVTGNNNQDQINTALSAGGVVHLNAGTYTISKQIVMTSGSTLEGASGAKIFLVNNAGWAKNTPIIKGTSVSNVRITGFEIDGNRANNEMVNGVDVKCGKYYYDMLNFSGGSNIEIDHMYLHHNWNDILHFSGSSEVKFHDNNVREPGHDVVYAIKSKNVWVENNYIRTYCNSGVRPDGTAPIYISNNDIARDTDAGGYAGIEIQGASEVWSCNNNIHDIATVVANLSGATIHTSGCTNAPTSAPIPGGTTSNATPTIQPGTNATPTTDTNPTTPVTTVTPDIITPTIYCIGSCPTNISPTEETPSTTTDITPMVSTPGTSTTIPKSLWGLIMFFIMFLLKLLGLGQ